MVHFTTDILTNAQALGFDACGITSPTLPSTAEQGLKEFLTAGHHGTMEWMERRVEQRANPKVLWPQVQSVIVVGHNYAPPYNPMEKLQLKNRGTISAYALNMDYHDVMKKRLKQFAGWLVSTYGCEVKLFVDTAPVLEKPLAEQAGIGWQGKHTCVVSRQFGSWLFLGEIFTTLPITSHSKLQHQSASKEESMVALRATPPETDHCGSCTRCLDICPTNAFTEARKLDARKCIAYLTIEHKGSIPEQYRKAIGNRVYGCDDCLAVCPWNKFAETSNESAYHARTELDSPPLARLLTLDETAFRSLFRKSPIKRIGWERFIRNVLIAAGNSGDNSLINPISAYCAHTNVVLKESAHWAIRQLCNGSH